MLLKLEACAHARVCAYDSKRPDRGTCLTCYRRMRLVKLTTRTGVRQQVKEWQRDTPAGICNHASKLPISDNRSRHRPYQDALCTSCGCVLRHPNGPGAWSEVVFNGFVIQEEL